MIQSNVDNVNHIRHQASKYFRNKKREYMKAQFRTFKQKVRTQISETCTEASVTSLEYSNG